MGKKKPKRRRERPEPSYQPYDAKMIREFLDHLKWELRTLLFELQQQITKPSKDTPLNPELMDQLQKHVAKRGQVLLPATVIDATGTTETEAKRVVVALSSADMKQRKRQLESLESLDGLFREALLCAAGPAGKMPIHELRAVDFLEDPDEAEDGEAD